ncbi:MAG: hypothetical protein H6737_00025 [Alphaproteobacteria bacterium]|nr:hypothetical protein [Alphaproteobacteria bacterium]
MRNYRYSKKAGAVQDNLFQAEEAPIQQQANLSMPVPGTALMRQAQNVLLEEQARASAPAPMQSSAMVPTTRAETLVVPRGGFGVGALHGGLDARLEPGWQSMFFYTVREGQRVLVTDRNGRSTIVEGPKRVFSWGKRIEAMAHYVAHPGDFLILRFRDGRQEHLPGPAHAWMDPREHVSIQKEEAVQIAAKEAVVVYSEADGKVSRRVVHGPETFVPGPGEWLHEFSWHGPAPGGNTLAKVPGALNFQKLWMMPDQMYHDVADVRTADDAVLTIRLMLFFELLDIETMLATTHDPIGDFVNAATSDVVDFVAKKTFDAFKSSTDRLNDLETYPQLAARAKQCGYRMDKVVYRGYGAPPALQRLHDEATENRVRLQLERATEQQAQELEDFKLDRGLARGAKERQRQAEEQAHQLAMAKTRHADELAQREAQVFAKRAAREADAVLDARFRGERDRLQREHLAELAKLGVDLTKVLTAGAPDRVIELRGSDGSHVHVDGK